MQSIQLIMNLKQNVLFKYLTSILQAFMASYACSRLVDLSIFGMISLKS